MPSISVTDAAARYSSQAGAAGQRFVEGAERFQGDPTQLAAAQVGKAQANYAEALSSGRWQRRLAEAGKQGWLTGIREKGSTAYVNGVTTTGTRKWAAAMQQWFPIFAQLEAQIATMPNNTTQDSINRVAAWINGTKAAKSQL